MIPKIGAHVSISGGYTAGLQSIKDKGGNCLQIFSSSPRDWKPPVISEDQIAEFKKRKEQLRIDPIYFHASYLINLANPDRGGDASVHSLVHELNLASMLEVSGSIIHLGSFTNGNYATLIENCTKVLSQTPEDTVFIIENAGTHKIGTTLEEIGSVVHDLSSSRVTVCLDTCHLHAAGYDLSTNEKFETFLSVFDKKIGLDRIELFHVNDSKDEFLSNRDRHENIGEGKISQEVFRILTNHPQTKNFPFIIETPGFDKKGPDKKNIDILKGFIHE